LEAWFDHGKLRVYRAAIEFCGWWDGVAVRARSLPAVKDQLDRAPTTMPLNIAEGNGKYSLRDRSRYLQSAVGSALECAACLDVLEVRRRLDAATATEGKQHLRSIVGMLIAPINSTADRVQEQPALYDASAGLRPGNPAPTFTPTPTL
jgi:four helix bundle protein